MAPSTTYSEQKNMPSPYELWIYTSALPRQLTRLVLNMEIWATFFSKLEAEHTRDIRY